MPEVFILLALLFIYFRWSRWSVRKRKIMVGLLGVVVYLLCTPFLISALVAHTERVYLPYTPKDSTVSHNVLVLGGGFNSDPNIPELTRLSREGLARIAEGVRLATQMPESTIITSGYFSTTNEDIAGTMRAAAISLGLAPERIHMQYPAHNTRAEARMYVEQFNPHDTLVLVTSAIHMPRAVKLFTKSGVTHIIPASCDYRVFPGYAIRWYHFIPSGDYLELWKKWGKEVVGGVMEL